MTELELIVNNKSLQHVGMFNYAEIIALVKEEAHKLGYHYHEKRNEQIVTQNGRNMYLELRCDKPVKYKISSIIIRINVQGMHEMNRNKIHAQAGHVSVNFDAWVKVEHTHGLERRSLTMLLTTLIDKLIYPIKDNAVAAAAQNDTQHLMNVLRNAFSRYKKRDPAYYNVDEINAQINKEIEKELHP